MMNRQTKRAVLAAIVAASIITPAQSKAALWVPQSPAIIKPAEFWKPHEKKFMPLVAMPITLGMLAGKVSNATVTYISRNNSSANASSYTFAAQNHGGPGIILLGVVGRRQNSGVGSISGATLGGVSMASQVALASDNAAAIFSLLVASGTAADIIVDISGTDDFARLGIGVWRTQNLLSATATATGTSTANPGSIASLAVSAGGIIVGISYAAATHTNTWGGTAALTENWDAGEVETNGYTGASKAFSADATPSITVTRTNNLDDVLVAAAFR